MDTTSNTLSRILQLLAERPDVQEKLRQELFGAGAAEGLTYDELNRLQLLDSICRETLRVYVPSACCYLCIGLSFTSYPPVTILFRE